MLRIGLAALLCLAVVPVTGAQMPPVTQTPTELLLQMQPRAISLGTYTVLAWNDLGMHCISPRFKEMAILPPANTLQAVVIRRGSEPEVTNQNVKLTYSFINNTTVAGKTDFWTYAPKLFGVNLKEGVGLAGNGLTGDFKQSGRIFEAKWIPILPYDDKMVWSPFQQAVIKLNGKDTGLRVVTPVSDELHCEKCHATGKPAAVGINTPTVEGNILTLHDKRQKTNLMAHRPVLCASCHSDNALNAPGKKGVSSMSLAMHGKHATVSPQPACYDCHPGPKTQCNRSAAPKMGPVNGNPKCATCHGDLPKMAQALKNGRQPWLQEPTCAQCHGPAYSTGKLLYRKATGHGGVPCIACHGSPHAWWPSKLLADNQVPTALQNNTRAIGFRSCFVCHNDKRSGVVPPHNED